MGHAVGVDEPEKPWWRTTTGVPAWWQGSDRHWHGWAFAAITLGFFAVLLLFAPTHSIAGPLAGAAVAAAIQAVRLRHHR